MSIGTPSPALPSPATGDLLADWCHTTAEIPPRGLDAVRAASPQQCAAIATAVNIAAVGRLEVRYRIEHSANGRFRLTGNVRANVTQACVVTLDPVVSDLRDTIDVEFWPTPEMPQAGEEEQSILDAEEHELIESHRMAVGRIVVETLAAALPAYPRTADAALDTHEAGPEVSGKVSPFAALAGWKPKSD